MPAVRDLHRLRRADASRLGIGAGSVAAHHLHVGVLGEPVRDGVCCAVGQHVQRPVRLDVNDDGAVHVPATEREIVDPDRG